MARISKEDAHTLAFQYSEFLDSQGLMVPESDGDPRTHDDLAKEFLASRAAFSLPVVEA